MDIINKIKGIRDSFVQKEVDFLVLQPENRTRGSDKLPVYPIWYYSPIRGIPRNIDVTTLREFAKSTWVQMVTNTIKKVVAQTEWDIILEEAEEQDDPGENENAYKEQIEYVKQFLQHPNRIADSTFQDIIDPMLSDVLEMDAGVWYMHRDAGKLLEIIPYDASTFLKEQDIHGFITRWWQFSFRNPQANPKQFSKEEICYFQMNGRTYNAYGFSPLQAVQQVVELLDQSTRYNKDFFLNNAIPSLIMSLPNANKESLKHFYDDWMSKFQGKPHKILMHNLVDHKVDQISQTNKDMEWLKGQQWYMHLVFGCYGLSPVEAGFYEDALKAGMEGQERVSVKNSVMPYLSLIEKKINRLIIPAILGEENLPITSRTPIKFEYKIIDAAQEKIDHEMQIQDVTAKILSVNEVRAERGLKPLSDEMANNPFKQPEVPMGRGGGFDAQKEKKPEAKKDDKQNKSINKSEDDYEHHCPYCGSSTVTNPREDRRGSPSDCLNCGRTFSTKSMKSFEENEDDYWMQAENYSQLLERMYDTWEKRVVSAVGQVNKKLEPSEIEKTVGEFIRRMTNGMTTTEFYNMIKRAVKKTLGIGMEQAEEELNINLTTSELFDRKAEAYAEQEFNGYTLPDGTKWHGISGASKQLQIKILNNIKEGLENKESTVDLKKRITAIFDEVRNGQAMCIARTESNRFVNEGKLLGYKESGIELKKKWVTFEDKHTCPICRSLDGQTRELSEPFRTSKGAEVMIPPCGTHPNCRCFIQAVK